MIAHSAALAFQSALMFDSIRNPNPRRTISIQIVKSRYCVLMIVVDMVVLSIPANTGCTSAASITTKRISFCFTTHPTAQYTLCGDPAVPSHFVIEITNAVAFFSTTAAISPTFVRVTRTTFGSDPNP